MRKYLVINTLMIFDISDEKTEVVQDSPAVVQTPEVEAVVEVEDEQPQKSPDVSQRFHHSLRKVCTRVRDGFSYFRSGGWINIWGGGGCCCLLWPGPGGNARKGQGKSLTKFVF